MAHVIKAVYEKLRDAHLQAGPPNDLISIESEDDEKLYSMDDIVNGKNLPSRIESAGFDFKDDENAYLVVFPETRKHYADGFLVEDFNKVEAVMEGVFKVRTPARRRTEKIEDLEPIETIMKRVSEAQHISQETREEARPQTRTPTIKPPKKEVSRKKFRGRRHISGEALFNYIVDLFKVEKRMRLGDVINAYTTDYGLPKTGKNKSNKKREITDKFMLTERRGITKLGENGYLIYVE